MNAKRESVAQDAPTAEPVTWTLRGVAISEFCRRVRAVAIAASSDSARPVLTGVLFESDGKTLTITATDSYRMYRSTQRTDLPPLRRLVPAKWLVRNLPKRAAVSDDMTVTFGERITFEFAGESFGTGSIGGQYPNVDTFATDYPIDGASDDSGEQYGFNPTYMADIFKAAALYVGDNRWVSQSALRVRFIDPMKPMPFEVQDNGAVLSMLLMPVRLK